MTTPSTLEEEIRERILLIALTDYLSAGDAKNDIDVAMSNITKRELERAISELNSLPNRNIESKFHGSIGVILVEDLTKRLTTLTHELERLK